MDHREILLRVLMKLTIGCVAFKKRIQDPQILDLVTMLRCGIWEQGQISYPPIGTAQGSVVSPLLANVFLHEFDDWYVRTYRLRPEWEHLAPSSPQYRRKKEIGTLMLTRYALLYGMAADRAEEIKAEIKAFLANKQSYQRKRPSPTLTMASNFGLSNSG